MAGKSCSQREPNVTTLAQIMQQYVLHRLWSLVICQHFYVVLRSAAYHSFVLAVQQQSGLHENFIIALTGHVIVSG